MAIDYTNGSGTGLFDILGKYFHALDTLNTARGTTVPAEVLDAVNQFKLKTNAPLAMEQAVAGLPTAESAWRSGGSRLSSALRLSAQGFLRAVVRDDAGDQRMNLTQSLEYLIKEMASDDVYVTPPVVSSTDYDTSDANGTIVKGDLILDNPRGVQLDNAYAEDVTLTVTTGGLNPTVELQGESAARNLLAEDWPGGSGFTRTLASLGVDGNLVSNGDFEAFTVADTPDDWLVVDGTPSTNFRSSIIAEHTVTISGTPTSGVYFLKYTHPIRNKVYATAPLSYNATAADVQTALRALPGLDEVTVTSTGTSPDFVHTIVFTGVAGQQTALTSSETFDTGSIAHAITVAGDDGAIDGKGLVLLASMAEFVQPVTLSSDQIYAVGFSLYRSGGAGVREVFIRLRDAVGGTVLVDDAGNSQSVSSVGSGDIDEIITGQFRVAAGQKMPVYLCLEAEADTQLIVDNLILAPATQLYNGGPYFAMFTGRTELDVDTELTGAIANDYAGEFQKNFKQLMKKNL